MEPIILIVAILSLLLSIAVLICILRKKDGNGDLKNSVSEENAKLQKQLREEIAAAFNQSIKLVSDATLEAQKQLGNAQKESIEQMKEQTAQKLEDTRKGLVDRINAIEPRLKTLEETNEQKLENIRKTVSEQLNLLREDNNKKLEGIQQVVDEKLQKTLEEKMNQSFKLVSERLEQVHKGLGEMQSIAAGVGDLKKVLSNVKTRGILGEIQLGAILSEILTPDQYDIDVPTIPRSQNRVEFAVKLPGADDGKHIYLPIDAKFPGDTYAALQEAYDSGDAERIAAAKKTLETVVKKCARDIKEKYVRVPHTTNFGIMFLPFEGLYAEVVNSGVLETIQRDYQINVTGPSTMAAMLNSLQMGFRTLAIQKHSNEVWRLLGEIKGEFTTFEKVLLDAQNRLRMVDGDLEKLVGVRTRQINRRLKDVDVIELPKSEGEMLEQ